jgi:hypothetical protein
LDGVVGIRWVKNGGKPVYRIVVPLVVFVLLAGCKPGTTTSRSPTPTTSPGKGTDTGHTATQTGTNHTTDKSKLYGDPPQTLEQWAKQLMDENDQAVSDNAQDKLAKIGAEQLPYITKAMDGKKAYIRLNTLDIFIAGKEWAKKEDKTLVPLLNKALHDDVAKVKQKAAEVVAALQFPESVEALRTAAAKDDDPQTRDVMKEWLAKIK